ncbi:NADPH-dependent FMN reductase [Pedobacter alluvionis]|uniref:NADPH-dependent FMN reductase-like domain-containing protein n=1 Tax=Pedobacter alluvionis TaxID=475253 RepID=A0ABY2HKM5_9SPHI|nr:NAD(P)H-dependent oxidoreductase [Pedobacter alluvionis]TFB28601.1 hypothetical protein E3V97_20960 [Pedobacter alluvionis]
MKKILAISGSTKAVSTNALYITAISRLLSKEFEVINFSSIAFIPHFNPDLDQENPPQAVEALRSTIKKADGIIYLYTRIRNGLTRLIKKPCLIGR